MTWGCRHCAEIFGDIAQASAHARANPKHFPVRLEYLIPPKPPKEKK